MHDLIDRILAQPKPAEWQGCSGTKNLYLDIVERIVRNAAPWIDENGAVIDPVINREWGQTSSRFASSCAVLIYFNRCCDLSEKLYKVMDYCCAGLNKDDSVDRSPNFWMRELATAYDCLRKIAPAERVEYWRSELAKVEPEKNYIFVSPDVEKRKEFHNWAVYSSAGESMRESYGIGGGDFLWGNDFFDAYMEYQMWRFNEYGMYRDPGDPFTYDITTRLQLEAAISAGYNGRFKEILSEKLDFAMLPTLLFVAPTGEVPFGGRSSQFYFQEGIVSALCERAAAVNRDKNPRLAGAYKRQAYLSARAVCDGILRDDGKLFHIKNRFAPETRHGCDTYGHYSVYSLFAGSVFALAAIYADDTIQDMPAPSELGNFSFALTENFYKGFANGNGNYLEFDLKSDLDYDSSGLGRIFIKNMPFGLLPAAPFCQAGHFCIAPDLQANEYASAIAPEWYDRNRQYHRLAQYSEKTASFREIAANIVEVIYETESSAVTYHADLSECGRLTLEVSVSGNVSESFMIVPVLDFDGEQSPVLTLSDCGFQASFKNKLLKLTSCGTECCISGRAVNRNGLYSLLKIKMPDNRITLHFSAE